MNKFVKYDKIVQIRPKDVPLLLFKFWQFKYMILNCQNWVSKLQKMCQYVTKLC